MIIPLLPSQYVCLIFYLIALLKPLHPSGSIHHPAFTGETRVALTAQLNLQQFTGRAGGKSIAAGANYLGIGVILGVYLILHAI